MEVLESVSEIDYDIYEINFIQELKTSKCDMLKFWINCTGLNGNKISSPSDISATSYYQNSRLQSFCPPITFLWRLHSLPIDFFDLKVPWWSKKIFENTKFRTRSLLGPPRWNWGQGHFEAEWQHDYKNGTPIPILHFYLRLPKQ